MKLRLIRGDLDKLGKRERLAVGIASTAIGAVLMVFMDTGVGMPLEESVRNILITLAAGAVFLFMYGFIQRRTKSKK